MITCSHVILISFSISSSFLRKSMCFRHLFSTIIFYELPGKNTFRDVVNVNLLRQYITLGMSDTLKCVDRHCASDLEKYLSISWFLYVVTSAFLKEQMILSQSDNHYWMDHHTRDKLIQSLPSQWEVHLKHYIALIQLSYETRIPLPFHLTETEMSSPNITAFNYVWLNSPWIPILLPRHRTNFSKVIILLCFKQDSNCKFSLLKGTKLFHLSWKQLGSKSIDSLQEYIYLVQNKQKGQINVHKTDNLVPCRKTRFGNLCYYYKNVPKILFSKQSTKYWGHRVLLNFDSTGIKWCLTYKHFIWKCQANEQWIAEDFSNGRSNWPITSDIKWSHGTWGQLGHIDFNISFTRVPCSSCPHCGHLKKVSHFKKNDWQVTAKMK